MPPWLPEPGYGGFANERRLSADEIKLIGQWISEGTVEGDPADLPKLPAWTEEWHLGNPDLVLQLPQSYTLGPEGKDVHRNFVIPIPVDERRYVQAVEFRPGNKSVHHVRILIDQTDQSRLGLLSELIDIPPGEKNYVVERTVSLPVDVQLLGVMPHLHYLGKEVQGFATMPNGARKWLILIKQWDFNWQGEFRYVKPVFLPKGTLVTMRYSYDNSAENLRNPNHPPRRVTFGPQSTDKMGELWL